MPLTPPPPPHPLSDKEVALSKVERISAEAAILEHKSHDLEAEVKRLREELETERERAMEVGSN